MFQKLASQNKTFVAWEWNQEEDHWERFEDPTFEELEIAWQRLEYESKTAPETLSGIKLNPAKPDDFYEVVLCTDPAQQMKQTNMRTNFERNVRRRSIAASSSSSSSTLSKCSLTDAQAAAREHARQHAEQAHAAVRSKLDKVFLKHDATATSERVDEVLRFVASSTELHINIDVFKKVSGGRTLMQVLCDEPVDPGPDGRLLNLFELHRRYPGGRGGGSNNEAARRSWESRMFGSAFNGKDEERPRYGNLNVLANRGGDAHAGQYGKSYFKMKPRLGERCTITSRDSSDSGAKLGTLKHCAHVLLDQYSMLKKAEQRDFVRALLALSRGADPGSKTLNLTKCYIEVQILGDVRIQRDVTMLVLSDEDAEKAHKQHTALVAKFKEQYNMDVCRITSTGRLVPGDFYDAASGSEGALSELKVHDAFLSHKQEDAQDLAKAMKER